ncbi:hypothetical protein GE21DRAFT_6677 [Neurospora crassa]|uniref:Asteroid domain-containing protein n=1 Tax=Neurospora crassa (strain ATCC 24698 / 74-OR23-1A / CBS 708.71 / DSM 1257 / FGSC 987) TaxID=367110 RepID=Q7S890_NEUCR|nr:hypothetical protein NCU05253 [Neurospora crassa OR74A]EAA32554.2 hypothetical protein NCU05253 [Neurospora crassa OR74A]KHE85357.1 hypothetical protein GE21DRAFT_6677 [Neurospora crassa]|eukprot:XP_961790.2 hypothetical protein NCU05253 [Neurospora crassa OR74A]
MGIPHLRKHLEPYAQRGAIQPSSLVIDGPALAYHILNLCRINTIKSSPFEQATYELLSRTTLEWLDRARTCGLTISRIFFDGYLPTSKTHERTKRLMKTSKELQGFHRKHVNGLTQGRPGWNSNRKVGLFPEAQPSQNGVSPPPPAFFVPSIIDTLRQSEHYASQTSVVPGEADVFCAQYVREHGGTVLTSDSDLLVHNLGPNGSVVFFSDMECNVAGTEITGLQFKSADICERLSLQPEDGLSCLAFELVIDPHITFEQAVSKAKSKHSVVAYPGAHKEFIEQYLSPETGSQIPVEASVTLDPRISEIVLRCRDEKPAMYLPFLLDSPTRTSAWESSKDIRQLAYAILQTVTGSPIPTVAEFRRLDQPSAGTPVKVPPISEVEMDAAVLEDVLSSIIKAVKKPKAVWMTLSVYQDVVMTTSQGKVQPLSLKVLQQAVDEKLDTTSWESVHFLAQCQATYYSLRMLQQIMQHAASQGKGLSPALKELQDCLTKLPSLPDFPTIFNFPEMLRLIIDNKGLSCLTKICADQDDMVPQLEAIMQPKKQPKSNKRKNSQEPEARPRSNNPFALLDAEC